MAWRNILSDVCGPLLPLPFCLATASATKATLQGGFCRRILLIHPPCLSFWFTWSNRSCQDPRTNTALRRDVYHIDSTLQNVPFLSVAPLPQRNKRLKAYLASSSAGHVKGTTCLRPENYGVVTHSLRWTCRHIQKYSMRAFRPGWLNPVS